MLPCFASAKSKKATPLHIVSNQELDDFLQGQSKEIVEWLNGTGFKADAGTLTPLPGKNGRVESYVYGRGDGTDAFILAGASAKLPEGRYTATSELTDLDILGWAMGTYVFDRYKAKPAKKKFPVLELSKNVDGKRLSLIAEGMFLTKDLINTPAEDMGPNQLEAEVRKLARAHKAKITVTKGNDLLKKGYRLIHAVGRASDEAPRLIDMTWSGAGTRKKPPMITLVGKGVCYDTGGLDLKPSAAMALMKKDMGGAGNVLGLAHMIMSAGLKVRLRVLIPAVENNVSANSFRTGDIFKSHKGTTVEIGNTDAEGRLILADALSDADHEKPDMIVDMATLTGAARVAMGPEVVPYFTDDDALAQELDAFAAEMADPMWRLPLWKPYAKSLSSQLADLKNVSDGPFGGAITAGLFLQHFVTNTKSWIHIDLYGWRPSPAPGRISGGESASCRALFTLLSNRYG